MTFLLLTLLVLCLLGLAGGFLFGFVQGKFRPWPTWALPLGLVLGALWLPGKLVMSRVRYVLVGAANAPEAVQAVAHQFAHWSILTLVLALLLTLLALLTRPFLAPLVPLALFVLFYRAVLPLAYDLQRQVETIYLDNIPTIWLFLFCAAGAAALLGYALGHFRASNC